MSFKPNFGNSYDYYNPQNVMGHSNVSRSYNKLSARSNSYQKKMATINTEDLVRSSLCSKMRERSLEKLRIALKLTLTMNEKEGLSLRTN